FDHHGHAQGREQQSSERQDRFVDGGRRQFRHHHGQRDNQHQRPSYLHRQRHGSRTRHLHGQGYHRQHHRYANGHRKLHCRDRQRQHVHPERQPALRGRRRSDNFDHHGHAQGREQQPGERQDRLAHSGQRQLDDFRGQRVLQRQRRGDLHG